MRRPYPVGRPPSIRDFMAFEEHVRNARATYGLDVPEAWYAAPAFYFSNPAAVYGDGDEVPRPPDTQALDYELELALVIGDQGRPEGFTIMNDWSARDLQAREMQVGLGPAKGKDFATSLGPALVSPDELPGRSRPARRGPRERRGQDRLAHRRDALQLGAAGGDRREKHAWADAR